MTDLDVAKGLHPNRSWYSNAYLRHEGHLTLPPLATTTAALGPTGIFTVGAIGELANVIYVAAGTSVRQYSLALDTWTNVHTLPAAATDAITVRVDATVYLIFATTGGYSYSSDGTTWVNDTTDTLYMTWWDNRLWGIDNTGQLWFSSVIGTEATDARLPLENGNVTDLFVERDAAGESIIYAATKVGLFAHDAEGSRFHKTDLELPFHDDAGRGARKWRGRTFYPAGLSIYEYSPGPTALVRTIGPDKNDGLPANRKGTIVDLVASHNDLLPLVDSTSAAANAFDVFTDQGGLSDALVIDPDVGVSSILAWNEEGWQVLWESATNTEAITAAHVSGAHAGYRLWWGHNRRVYRMDLPVDIVNPNETSDFNYASSATHEFPWLLVGQETQGLVLRLRVEAAGMSANETVVVSYATNFSTTFTTLGTISADGITTYNFPNSTTPTGTAFRAIRIRLVFARGTNTLLSPDIIGVDLEWRKKISVRYRWTVVLDLNLTYGGRSPQAQRAALVTAIASNPKVEFTYREDTGDTRNYYVEVVNMGAEEQSGRDETGRVMLQLEEV